MPQLSKKEPRKTYSGFPANLSALEYMTFLGRVHIADVNLGSVASATARYIFYHATRPYGLSVSVVSDDIYKIGIYSSLDSGFPGIVTPITPNTHGFHCTNRFQPTTFGITFGTIASDADIEHEYVDGENYLAEMKFSFFTDYLGFVCEPEMYYVFSLTNESASTANQNARFQVVDFLGVN